MKVVLKNHITKCIRAVRKRVMQKLKKKKNTAQKYTTREFSFSQSKQRRLIGLFTPASLLCICSYMIYWQQLRKWRKEHQWEEHLQHKRVWEVLRNEWNILKCLKHCLVFFSIKWIGLENVLSEEAMAYLANWMSSNSKSVSNFVISQIVFGYDTDSNAVPDMESLLFSCINKTLLTRYSIECLINWIILPEPPNWPRVVGPLLPFWTGSSNIWKEKKKNLWTHWKLF